MDGEVGSAVVQSRLDQMGTTPRTVNLVLRHYEYPGPKPKCVGLGVDRTAQHESRRPATQATQRAARHFGGGPLDMPAVDISPKPTHTPGQHQSPRTDA